MFAKIALAHVDYNVPRYRGAVNNLPVPEPPALLGFLSPFPFKALVMLLLEERLHHDVR